MLLNSGLIQGFIVSLCTEIQWEGTVETCINPRNQCQSSTYNCISTIKRNMADKIPPVPVYKDGIWSGPKVSPTPDYFRFGEKLYNSLKNSAEFIGQIDAITEEKDTFDMMLDRSVRCAIWLKKQGVKPGDVIGYCSKNNLDSFAPVFASFYIATIFNPWWDSCLEEGIIKYFIEFTKPKVIFIDKASADIILKSLTGMKNKPKIVAFGKIDGLKSFRDIIMNEVSSDEVKNFQCTTLKSPNDPAVIMYTSGTTGNPKGALYSNGSFANMLGFFPDYEGKKIGMWFASLCWISGIGSLARSIFLRSTSIIHDCSGEEEACRLIEKFGVTWLTMGTAMANRLYKTEAALKYDLSKVNRVSFGGGVIKAEVSLFLKKLFPRAIILAVYGATELGGALMGLVSEKKPTTSGKVFQNTELKIVDPETSKILGPNEEGEVCARGPPMMICYWNNSKATAEAIDAEGWYHTGDVGHYDEDGDFYITERMKELIKYRLHHVPPAAIESIIQDHPAIAEVGVVGKPDNDDMEQPIAFITKRPGAKVTEAEIIQLVENKLHDRMRLRGGVCFLDKMPHTASGKIAKKELRARARAMVQ